MSMIKDEAMSIIDKTRKEARDQRDSLYSAFITASNEPENTSLGTHGPDIIAAYTLAERIATRMANLESLIVGKPIEDVVYICQHCGNVVWEKGGGEWVHRNPQPAETHDPVPYRFAAAPEEGAVDVVDMLDLLDAMPAIKVLLNQSYWSVGIRLEQRGGDWYWPDDERLVVHSGEKAFDGAALEALKRVFGYDPAEHGLLSDPVEGSSVA